MTRTVLVVDDEPDIREIARLSLEHVAGWTVLVAGSGADGIAVAASEQPDAILLDVMMPEMDGPETARRLAADPRTAAIPVLLLTAQVLSSERAALADAPVAAILAKPFDPMTLGREISDALGWQA
ncbi:MAG TPA: response regulator [Actinotalea sp.]